LRSVVRAFQERRADLSGDGLAFPVAARPHQILDIHLADPYRVGIDDGAASVSPGAFIVGPQTYRRAYVHMSGVLHVFNILFQPTGLNRLTGVNMLSLVNRDAVASDLLGSAAASLCEAVLRAPDFASRVAAAEHCLGTILDARGPESEIGHASRRMIASRGDARISDLAAASGLSASQFQRRFAAEVGMAPKLYARTIRFDRAVTARREEPGRSWTDIIHDFGYFDQAHFIRECHAFAGLAPTSLIGDWDNAFSPAND
ncbi:MAG TPA: helix-turn-helix domain-containing protein, partial [Hyphomonadaceae bacterium]|nr:helix-turn-helix domain-containing protein [Hyphomonadaceae bacterium]